MTQMNFGPKKSYKTAPEATTPAKKAQTNFQGGGSSYRSSRSKPQVNVDISLGIRSKTDTQGVKGTGSQGGY